MNDGVCSSSPPAVAVFGGRRVLVGTPYEVDELIAALRRGEEPPGLTPEQLRFAQSLAESAYS